MLAGRGGWMAAVMAGGPQAVLSHAAAAALWDLRGGTATTIDITIPVPAADGDARTCASTAPGASTARSRSPNGSRSPRPLARSLTWRRHGRLRPPGSAAPDRDRQLAPAPLPYTVRD